MTSYSFLEEARLARKLAIGAAGVGALGALAGNIVSRTNYQAPNDEMLVHNHEVRKEPLAAKINAVQAEINQILAFRARLENGDPDINVPIQQVNAKLARKYQLLRKLKLAMSKMDYVTTQDLRDAHKKAHIRKGTITGGAIGASLGGGVGALV